MSEKHFDVVMLTTVHSAVDDRILHREAKTLRDAGLAVCVIGPHPHPEVVEGVTILPLARAESRFARLGLHRQLFRKALDASGELYIFHDPELFGVAVLLRVLGKRVVYDAHENLPMQVLQKDWIPRPLRYAIFPLVWAAEWLGAHLLSGVIVARPNLLQRFSGVPCALIRNFPTACALRTLAPKTPVEQRRNIALYTGSLTRTYGIEELVRAFADLPEAELWLAGPFSDAEFEQKVRSAMTPNVRYLGRMPFREVLSLYGEAKVGSLLLYPSPNNRYSMPIKLFEYMAAGLPVLRSNLPELEEMTEGCSISVDPTSVEQIRDGLARLFADPSQVAAMSATARQRALSEFIWEPEGERLVRFCSELMTPEKAYSPSPQA